jgi:outer membrane protein OmpA-like peptidoglycan-associated protein
VSRSIYIDRRKSEKRPIVRIEPAESRHFMNPNFIEMAQSRLTGDVVQKFGSYLGESPDNTRRAFGSALPAVLSGFSQQASRASSDPESSGFMRKLAEGGTDASMLDNLPALAAGGAGTDALLGRGQGMLGSIFGDRLGGVVDQVAGSSGISKGSAGKVLSLAAPLLAATIGREAKSRNLGAMGIADMLTGQKEELGAAPRTQEVRVPATGVPLGRRLGLPLPLILFAVAALAALMFLFRPKRPVPPAVHEPPRMGRVEAPKAPQVFGGGPIDSSEQIKQFIADPNAHVPKRFALDGVSFAPNSAVLSPAAPTSVESVAAAMKQDPRAKVRIEAFVDSTGDPSNDQRLSVQRAYAVRDDLVRQGVDPARIAIAGYGAEHPVAPADTPEGRAKNSRVEVVVTDR